MNRNNSEAFYILALDGGGTRGIYSARVLANIEQSLGEPIKDCFNLIAGTSTGSIVAGAAAAAIPMKDIVELFETESFRIFKKNPLRSFVFQSRYSRNPLESVVRSCVPGLALGDISTPLLITSSDLSTGGVHVFKSRNLRDLGEPYFRDGDTLLSDAILASCSAPTYFDPAQVDSSLLADGGLWANNPSVIALTEAVSKFGRPVETVYALSVGTGHSANLYRKKIFWGLMTGWGRQKLVSYVMGLQSQASSNIAKLLLGDRYLRLDPEIEDWNLDNTKNLENMKALADRDFAHRGEAIMGILKRKNGHTHNLKTNTSDLRYVVPQGPFHGESER